jgi:N-acetyl sugar amidotransferase
MLQFCKNCFTPSTRPRITFNEHGICNACQWAEDKKNIDWEKRQKFFGSLCDKYRGNGNTPDVIVPWSGGKDSIYVAYKMLDFGMTPLLMTVIPALETEIGKWNRRNICKDFRKLEINLKEDKYRSLAKKYFVEDGRPKHPWECAIQATILKQATELHIPLIVYGEEGEMEYGGSQRERNRWNKPVDIKYLSEYYWQGGKVDWTLPTHEQFRDLYFTQWSRFENWQPYKHADFAVCKGMRTEPVRNIGTFTGTAQLSDKLQDLHAYLMFVKFGFGRCTSDVAIAIRDGWTNQEEGLEWIEAYDGEFPNKFMEEYLEYFDMKYDEFSNTIAKFADNKILERATMAGATHIWSLKEWVGKWRRKGTPNELVSPNRFNIN